MNQNYLPLSADRIKTEKAVQKMAWNRRGGLAVETWQTQLREKLFELLGYQEPRKRPPLNYRSIGSFPDELGSIEKFEITVAEGVDIPGYICLPKNTEPPYDWFICVQGHSTGMHNSIGRAYADESKRIDIPGDRDFALGCLRRGIAAVCIEQRGFGERRDLQAVRRGQKTACEGPAGRALLMGSTLLAGRLYDIKCTAEMVAARNDCRAETLGLMGNSGGGTATLFAAALFPELIKRAIPSCYVNTFDASILAMHHCICNFVPDLYNWADMADIAGLIAPRPMVVVSGVQDDIFPIEASRKAWAQISEIYAALNAETCCAFVEGAEGHRFYARQAWDAYAEIVNR